MRCPECNLENEAHAIRCTQCGADLTQAALMEPTAHRANQVWNTDIDAERNRQNSRVALAVLGIAVALVIALVVCLAVYLPNVLSYSMDGMDFSLPQINILDAVEEMFEPRREPVAAPEPLIPMGEYDYTFIDILTAYAIELSSVDDPDMQREIHQMFYPEFEYLLSQEFAREELSDYVWWLLDRMGVLCNSDAETIEYLQAQYDLSTVILTLNEGYDFLRAMPDVEAYFTKQQLLTEAAIEVENSLRFQLQGAAVEWSEEYGCYVVYYTNDTPYTVDVKITNDFVTATECYSTEETYYYNFSGTTLSIPLYDMEKVVDQDHAWTIDWEVVGIYEDLTPLDEYYD